MSELFDNVDWNFVLSQLAQQPVEAFLSFVGRIWSMFDGRRLLMNKVGDGTIDPSRLNEAVATTDEGRFEPLVSGEFEPFASGSEGSEYVPSQVVEEVASTVADGRSGMSETTVRRHQRLEDIKRFGIILRNKCDNCANTKRVHPDCVQYGAGTHCMRCYAQGLKCSLVGGEGSIQGSVFSNSSNTTVEGLPVRQVGLIFGRLFEG